MKTDTELCPWEEILGFKSDFEFKRFLVWINEQVQEGVALKVTKLPFEEAQGQHFLHKESGIIWQLIWPDISYLTGSFRRVKNKCPWNKVDAFSSYVEFETFLLWIEKQVKLGKAKEMTVKKPRALIDDKPSGEKWYLHVQSSEVWRLLWPDPPFRGEFERIIEDIG